MRKILFFSVIVCLLAACGKSGEKVLVNAFSHNDEHQSLPLEDALRYKFNNVEADAYYIDGHFYVSHDRPDILSASDLMDLYFNPLFERIRKNGGSVYKDYKEPFYLMIDIKENGDQFYNALKPFLEANADMFCRVENGAFHKGPVLLFFSGSRPMETLPNENVRYAFLDGKFSDLGQGISENLMPVVSDNYEDYLKWSGEGKMAAEDLNTLRGLIKTAHQENKKIRLWGAPDKPSVMKMQLDEGMDLIGTDSLRTLTDIILSR